VLPRHSVTASLLARLCVAVLTGAALKSAAEALRTPFALETFYRLIRRLRRRLDAVRAGLCRQQPPPPSSHTDPLLHTVEHLQALFGGATNVVAGFQLGFQRPLLG
jgi:hypothetical protein